MHVLERFLKPCLHEAWAEDPNNKVLVIAGMVPSSSIVVDVSETYWQLLQAFQPDHAAFVVWAVNKSDDSTINVLLVGTKRLLGRIVVFLPFIRD
jgi:hypothetical protein